VVAAAGACGRHLSENEGRRSKIKDVVEEFPGPVE
jgi:hypothetical protein